MKGHSLYLDVTLLKLHKNTIIMKIEIYKTN